MLNYDSFNVAEFIDGLLLGEAQKPQRGRPIAIVDLRLWNMRDQLVFIFENHWHYVGDRLRLIKKPADVIEALADLKSEDQYVVKCLLRPSSVPATAKWLTVTRRKLGELNVAVYEANENREKCRQSLEIAQRALSVDLSDHEKIVVQEQLAKRIEKFERAEGEYLAADDRQKKMQELLLDGEGSFGREEFVEFCKSDRYRLKPLNVANALAGLPHIGWRRSAKRCKSHAAPAAGGRIIQVFDTIEKILRSCTRRSLLVVHAERWLRAQKGATSQGVRELQEKWYYLDSSIKTALGVRPRVRSRDLPFVIARDYWKRVNLPSNVDRLFEEGERIEPK